MSVSFQRKILVRALKAADMAVVCASAVIALAIRYTPSSWPSFTDILLVRVQLVNILLLSIYLLFCSLIFTKYGFYDVQRRLRKQLDLRRVTSSVNILTVVLLALWWPLQLDFLSVNYVGYFWIVTMCAFFLSHMLTGYLLRAFWSRGKGRQKVVIIGEGDEVRALANRLQQETTLGYDVLRIVTLEESYEPHQLVAHL